MGVLPPVSLSDAIRNNRRAWSRLSGCEKPPADPYTEHYLEGLFARLPLQRHNPFSWEQVANGFLEALKQPDGCRADLVLVSVRNGSIAALTCRNTSWGVLSHFREFKFLLAAAAQLSSSSDVPLVDAAFVLDLTDRADRKWADGILPRFASTHGACAASLPIPITLKGFGSNGLLATRTHATCHLLS